MLDELFAPPRKRVGRDKRWGAGMPVPFPVESRAAVVVSLQRRNATGENLAPYVAKCPKREVALCTLVATQPTVCPDRVLAFLVNPNLTKGGKKSKRGIDVDIPFVLSTGGKNYIVDGHHRCVAAVARGDSTIIVRYADAWDDIGWDPRRERKGETMPNIMKGVHAYALTAELADDKKEKVPTEFRIFPMGEVDTSKGIFLFDEKAAESVMEHYKEQGNDLSLDYEHMAVSDPPIPAPAAGYFKLEMRKDGLYAVDIRWTDRALEMLKGKEYKYFSPAFAVDEEHDPPRITKLLNVALTNIPATKNMTPLIAAKQGEAIEKSRVDALKKLADDLDAKGKIIVAKMTRRYTRGLVAGLAASGFVVAELRFTKSHWTKAGARSWAKAHKFLNVITKETSTSYRMRQKSTSEFTAESLKRVGLLPAGKRDKGCKITAIGGALKVSTSSPSATNDTTNNQQEASMPRTARKTKKTSASKGGKAAKITKSTKVTKTSEQAAADKAAADKAAADKATADKLAADKAAGEASLGDDEDSADSMDSSDSSDTADSSDSADSMEASGDEEGEGEGDEGGEEEMDDDESMDSADSSDSVDEDASEKTSATPAAGAPGAAAPAGVATKAITKGIGKLTARVEAREAEVKTLSAKLKKIETDNFEKELNRLVKKGVKSMRLAPKRVDYALNFGRKHGLVELRGYIKSLPKQEKLQSESTQATDVKVIATSLTKEDRAVMQKMGIKEEDYVKTRALRMNAPGGGPSVS